MTRDGIAGLICLAVALGMLVLRRGLPQSPFVPIGPDFYPRVVLIIMVVLSVILIASELWRKRAQSAPVSTAPAVWRDVVIAPFGAALAGAVTPVADLIPALAPLHPSLAAMLTRFASAQVRAAATVGGNIANGSPIGDSMPCLMALGAVLVLRRRNAKGKEETRRVSLDDFYVGLKRSVLQPGELIEAMELPRPQQRQFRAHKISKRFEQDISATCAANSRVGARTKLRGMRARARPLPSRVIIGSTKLAVFPVPVCAMPSTSRPSSACGIAPS